MKFAVDGRRTMFICFISFLFIFGRFRPVWLLLEFSTTEQPPQRGLVQNGSLSLTVESCAYLPSAIAAGARPAFRVQRSSATFLAASRMKPSGVWVAAMPPSRTQLLRLASIVP